MTIQLDAQVDVTQALIDANTQSFVEAFKVEDIPLLGDVCNLMMRSPAKNITQTILEYDANVSEGGLSQGSQQLLDALSTKVQAYNTARIPTSDPLLIVSNHPGMTDAMAIFASLTRRDIKVVGRKNPILSLLNGIRQHIIFINETEASRIATLRTMTRHLKSGGTVMTFPYGGIEPDPALHLNAVDTLADWSPSIALFARHVPNLQILPVAAGGVISRQALSNPITKLYKTQARRDWVAATLMVMFSRYREVSVSVRFGEPIAATEPNIMDAVRSQMHDLLLETHTSTSIDAIVPD